MSLTDGEVAAMLAPAGLHFVGRAGDEVRWPLGPYVSPATMSPEQGRFDHEPVDVDDVDMPAKVNAEWWRMATEYGLLDERREFLISISQYEPDSDESDTFWAHVRLLDEWDFASCGVEFFRSWIGGTFTQRFVPEFITLSLDGLVVVETTVWGSGTVSTIAIRPDRAPGHKAR